MRVVSAFQRAEYLIQTVKQNPLDVLPVMSVPLDHADKVIDIHIPAFDWWRWAPPGLRAWRERPGLRPRCNQCWEWDGRRRGFSDDIQPMRATTGLVVQFLVGQIGYRFGGRSE
jgi:hypothetical protein